jgi:hypothetical protein
MKTKAIAFTKDDIGCYADGCYGWDHVRETLADLIDQIDGTPDLIASLNGEMPDDAGDEYEALDVLNDATEAGLIWTFDNVDLLLMEADND